jgi:hypothetical protein
MWTLTLDDELKTDYDGSCVSTTGLLVGGWEDKWNTGKQYTVKQDGNKVTYSHCDGALVGAWADPMSPHVPQGWKICQDGTALSTSGGATGTYENGKGTMNFGGTVVTFHLDGDKIVWSNGNAWTKKAGSEDVNTGTLDGGELTWTFGWTGETFKGDLIGNKIHWDNDNVWTRVTKALAMGPCTGSTSEKWAREDTGSMKSLFDDKVCLTAVLPNMAEHGIAAGECPAESKVMSSWSWLLEPSWVNPSPPAGAETPAPEPATCELDCYLCYCNAYQDLRVAFCSGGECVDDGHLAKCKTHWYTHGRGEGRTPNPQQCATERPCEQDCYLCYCNAYPDLQNAFCGGAECSTGDHQSRCMNHWNTHGKGEGRTPNPEQCASK